MTDTAQQLRSRMRTDLVAAMKARDNEVVTALRTALAAIDNAEAVEPPAQVDDIVSEHVAGAQAGVGATEAERRELSVGDVRALVHAHISELVADAASYETLGQHEAAQRLRLRAEALDVYLTEDR